MRKSSIIAAALLGGLLTASAAVTVQGWWRFGETADYYADFSGNNRRFGNAFSSAGSGTAGGVISTVACGGPLGTTGATSTRSVLFDNPSGSMWNPAGYLPPAANYLIELWCLPVAPANNNVSVRWAAFFLSGV